MNYLESWTGVNVRPEGGGLKNTGQINDILLGRLKKYNFEEARLTFFGLLGELLDARGGVKGPVFRMFEMDANTVINTFKKDQIYISPCFEAFSKDRLKPGAGLPANYNTRLIIIDPFPPAADLEKYNAFQKEVLVAPGTLFAVSAVRTYEGVKEVGLKYIGNADGDERRARAVFDKAAVEPELV